MKIVKKATSLDETGRLQLNRLVRSSGKSIKTIPLLCWQDEFRVCRFLLILPGLRDGALLFSGRQVVKFTARVCHAVSALVLKPNKLQLEILIAG